MKRKETWIALAFISPWIIGFGVFMVYPLIASVYYSFCDYSVLRPPVWVGMANYRDLANDTVFWKTLDNTGIYAFFAIIFGTALSIGLALMLNAKIRFMTVYRTIFFIPSLVPTVALAVLWMWVFNSDYGVLNVALGWILAPLHLKAPDWLSDPNWSKPALILLTVWTSGNAVVIYLAGLQDVPQPLYEAADLDGAGWWARTWNVTVPMLSPVILFNTIVGMIGALQVFAVPYVMFPPGGGPARSTYFYTSYLFDNAFIFHKMGMACAMGWIMFLIILALTLTALNLSRRHVYYGGS